MIWVLVGIGVLIVLLLSAIGNSINRNTKTLELLMDQIQTSNFKLTAIEEHAVAIHDGIENIWREAIGIKEAADEIKCSVEPIALDNKNAERILEYIDNRLQELVDLQHSIRSSLEERMRGTSGPSDWTP